jgi:hypothetical protein
MEATKHPSIQVSEHPSDKHHRSEQRVEVSKSIDVSSSIEATTYPTPPGNTSIASRRFAKLSNY